MRLTPDEIKARRFRLAPNGYECEAVDRFLAEIIESLEDQPLDIVEADEFGRVGQEIAAVLRSARDSAGAMRAEAEGLAASMRSRAELEAADVRKQAEAEAEAAKQMLIDAQNQAEAIIRDAEQQASATLAEATEQARGRAQQITARADRQAEQVRRGERAAHQRLLAARTDLQHAIDRLGGTDEQPVLDLTTAPPHVRTGGIHIEAPSAGTGEPPRRAVHVKVDAPGLGAAERADGADRATDPGASGDPLLRMVRAAVGRAAEHSLPDDLEDEAPAV
jgi:DivIVA domain-containing protein